MNYNTVCSLNVLTLVVLGFTSVSLCAQERNGSVSSRERGTVYETGGDRVSASLSYYARASSEKNYSTTNLKSKSELALSIRLGPVTKPFAELVSEGEAIENTASSVYGTKKDVYFRVLGDYIARDTKSNPKDTVASLGKSISRSFSSKDSISLDKFTPGNLDSIAKNFNVGYNLELYGEIGAKNSSSHSITSSNSNKKVGIKSSAEIYGDIKVRANADASFDNDNVEVDAEVNLGSTSIFKGKAEHTAESTSTRHPHDQEGRTLLAKTFVGSNVITEEGRLRGSVKVDANNWLLDGTYDGSIKLWDKINHSNIAIHNDQKSKFFGLAPIPGPIGNNSLRTPAQFVTTHPDTCPAKSRSSSDTRRICYISHRSFSSGRIFSFWGGDKRYSETLNIPLFSSMIEPEKTHWSENLDDDGNDGFGIDFSAYSGANIRARIESKAYNECINSNPSWTGYDVTEYGEQIFHLHVDSVKGGNIRTCGIEETRSGNKIFFRISLEDKNGNKTPWRYFAPIYYYAR